MFFKKFMSLIAITAIYLTGCSYTPFYLRHDFGYTGDVSPLSLSKEDSIALQVAKSAFGRLPYDLKDSEPPQQGKQAGGAYGEAALVGMLSGGVVGLVGSTALIGMGEAGGSWAEDFTQIVIWLPADQLTIDQVPEIRRRVIEEYLAPAAQRYAESSVASNHRPASKVHHVDSVEGIYGDGAWCRTIEEEKRSQENCLLIPAENIAPVRYATRQSLPFTPTSDAQRYIIARVTDFRFSFHGVTTYLDNNGAFSMLPKLGYRAEHLSQFTDAPIGHPRYPTVYEGEQQHLLCAHYNHKTYRQKYSLT